VAEFWDESAFIIPEATGPHPYLAGPKGRDVVYSGPLMVTRVGKGAFAGECKARVKTRSGRWTVYAFHLNGMFWTTTKRRRKATHSG